MFADSEMDQIHFYYFKLKKEEHFIMDCATLQKQAAFRTIKSG